MMETGVILVAEDNDDDILLIRRAFKKANLVNPLHIVRDGEEAISYLTGEGRYGNRDEYPLPDLMLLDIKMPRKNGFEVLQWIRNEPRLACLRIVMLTNSEDISDVNHAYR